MSKALDATFWQKFGAERDGIFTIDGSNTALSPDAAFAHARLLHGFSRVDVTQAQTENGHAVALALAAGTNAGVLFAPEGDSAVASLAVPAEPEEVVPLDEPNRPKRMDPKFPIERPESLANDYTTRIDRARVEPMPRVPISVVIPVYNRIEMLRRTLACLTHQTYPRKLIEIVIADDGSSDNPDSLIGEFKKYFRDIKYLRQEDDGYRLSEVRNLGLHGASHDFMILLDCDMAPVPRMVELYARHLTSEPNAVYCGHRRYVDANDVTPDAVLEAMEPMLSLVDIRPDNKQVTTEDQDGPTTDWRLPIYQETDGLRHERHPFRAVCGGNIGLTKSAFASVGDFDVDFRAWGGEDAEWGYRAWSRGLYIVPLLDACGLHQEPPGGRNETDREAGKKETHPLLIERIPVRFRRPNSPELHAIPMVSIYIPAYNAQATIISAIDSALAQSITDLEVCVVDDGSTDQTAAVVSQHYDGNPRVRLLSQPNGGIGAASEAAVRMCRAPFIGQLDADDLLKPDAVEKTLTVLRSDPRIGVVYSSSELIDENNERIGDSYEYPHYSRYALMYGMIIHHFRLFRARDWYRTSGFASDIANAVDYDMYLKLAEVTEMVHLPEQSYRYRKHSTSTSQSRQAAQRLNHRLVIGRALERRGLSHDWELSQLEAEDVRKYEFVPADSRAELHFGSGLDTVRIRVDAGAETAAVFEALQGSYPGWNVGREEIDGRNQIITRPVSHARAVRATEQIQQSFPDAEIEVMYQ